MKCVTLLFIVELSLQYSLVPCKTIKIYTRTNYPTYNQLIYRHPHIRTVSVSFALSMHKGDCLVFSADLPSKSGHKSKFCLVFQPISFIGIKLHFLWDQVSFLFFTWTGILTTVECTRSKSLFQAWPFTKWFL